MAPVPTHVGKLTNHLGNVLTVITDRKRGLAASGTDIQWYEADVMATQQYYPFGMLMPTSTDSSLRRQYSLNEYEYRYGFNTQEKDNEIYGNGNSYSAEFWQYDPRIGRRWNIDPKPNASVSVFSGLGNNPIWYNDILGDTLRGTTKRSADRAMVIIKESFSKKGGVIRTHAVTRLFKLDEDGKTFSTIGKEDFNQAISNLSRDEKALATGYFDAINGKSLNLIEIVKRKEKISDIGSEQIHESYRDGKDLDYNDFGGLTLKLRNGKGYIVYVVQDAREILEDQYSDKLNRPSLPGELLAHELLGHVLGAPSGSDGIDLDEAIQSGNLFLRVYGEQYYRILHGSYAKHSNNFNPSQIPKHLSKIYDF